MHGICKHAFQEKKWDLFIFFLVINENVFSRMGFEKWDGDECGMGEQGYI